jgi:hypothetical protein
MVATFTANSSNGKPITKYELMYNQVPPFIASIIESDKSTLVDNLSAGVTYSFQARAYNEYGWSNYSAPSQARTSAGAWVKVGTVWKEAVPYVNVAGSWRVSKPWVRLGGIWREGDL